MPCLFEFRPFDGVSVTAVDSFSFDSQEHFLAIGSESGEIQVWLLRFDVSKGLNCTKLFVFAATICHGSSVRRLRWNPQSYLSDSSNRGALHKAELASCGDDNFVRIFQIEIQSLSFGENKQSSS